MLNLDELRKKSPAKKKLISLTVSASITGIIFFVWLSTFWTRLTPIEARKDDFSDIAAPLASIKDNFSEAYSSFKKLLNIGSQSLSTDEEAKSF